MALGYLNMTEEEFNEMRLGTYSLKLLFWLKAREEQFMFTANVIRMQTMILFNTQVAQENRVNNPTLLWSFPWEEAEIIKEGSEVRDNLRKLQELGKKIRNGE